MKTKPFSQLFRLIFVVFSLYLLSGAFSRWDGFSYYASFYEFLPAVALASILWNIVVVLVSILIWFSFRMISRIFRTIGFTIKFEHLLLFAVFFILSIALAWKGKKILWPDVQTTAIVKSAVLFGVSFAAMVAAWMLRQKAGQWTVILVERSTPLVWLFGIFAILSVPIVFYHAWIKGAGETVQKVAAVTSAAERNSPNIILVTFDALAANNMSVYGYDKETTPFISSWAENSTIFNTLNASSNFTTPAVASLMTGKRVWTHQTYHIEGSKPVRSNIESLPYILKKNGYFNIALVVNPFASVKILSVADSFDIAPSAAEFGTSASLFGWKFGIIDKLLYRAFGEKIKLHNWILNNEFILSKVLNYFSRNISQTTVPPDKVFNRFLDIIDDNLQSPFFAWIHVFPPHDPYLPPENYLKEYPSIDLRSYKSQERLIEESYKFLFQLQRYPEAMQGSVDIMRGYYDEFIKYIDNKFEIFIDELNKRQLENTVIILSADHGESFEHGYFTHGGPFLFEQVTHIPLIIKEPWQNTGQVVSDPVEQIDVPASILDFANIAIPDWMEGRSLVPLMRGEHFPDRPLFSMNFQDNRSLGQRITNGSIAVWEGDYKLIHYLNNGESLLFNLKQDPEELSNLFDREKERSDYLLGLIQDNLEKANKRIELEKAGHVTSSN